MKKALMGIQKFNFMLMNFFTQNKKIKKLKFLLSLFYLNLSLCMVNNFF